MIIGYVLDDTLDKPDGVQQAMITIAEKMRNMGHEVHYIVPHTQRQDLQNVHSVAKVISMKFNGNTIRTPISSSKKRIKKLLREVKFDVLHVQMPYSPIMAARIIKMAPKSVKIFGTFHILPYNFVAKFGTKLLGLYLWRNKKRFNRAFAVSPPALEFMEKTFGLRGEILPNPINYTYYSSFRSEKRDNAKSSIVFVGRFEERKGVKQLVQAYAKLPDREGVTLTMCGKGPLLPELQQFSEDNGLGIVFTGFANDETKAQYLSRANIAVFPSTAGESFGVVLTEAMSAGASITIGGNNPGYASVLGTWPECLFDPNDIDGFATKLRTLLDNPKLRLRIGDQQHKAVQNYDVDIVCGKLLQHYCA